MEAKERLKIAKELLADKGKNATDATAFIVRDYDGSDEAFDIFPDLERRGDNLPEPFYHSRDVVNIVKALDLNMWVSACEHMGKMVVRVHVYV